MPDILRGSGASDLANKVAAAGFETPGLDDVEQVVPAAWGRTFPGTDMVQEGYDRYNRWQAIRPPVRHGGRLSHR